MHLTLYVRGLLIIVLFSVISSAIASKEIVFGLLKTPQMNEKGESLNIEYIGLFNKTLLGAYINVGVDINLAGYTSGIYSGLVWQKIFMNNIFVAINFGGIIHNGRLKKVTAILNKKRYFGSRILFRESIDIGYIFQNKMKIAIFINHISNANLALPNHGLTNLGVRYAFVL